MERDWFTMETDYKDASNEEKIEMLETELAFFRGRCSTLKDNQTVLNRSIRIYESTVRDMIMDQRHLFDQINVLTGQLDFQRLMIDRLGESVSDKSDTLEVMNAAYAASEKERIIACAMIQVITVWPKMPTELYSIIQIYL